MRQIAPHDATLGEDVNPFDPSPANGPAVSSGIWDVLAAAALVLAAAEPVVGDVEVVIVIVVIVVVHGLVQSSIGWPGLDPRQTP